MVRSLNRRVYRGTEAKFVGVCGGGDFYGDCVYDFNAIQKKGED